MKVIVRAPWAGDVLFYRIGVRPKTGQVQKVQKKDKAFHLELPPGFSYLLFARRAGKARSALVSTGPSMERAQTEISLFPHALRAVPVKLEEEISSLYSLAWIPCRGHRPAGLPGFPLSLETLKSPFFCLGSMQGKAGSLVLWKETETACLFFTAHGPFLRALSPPPPGESLNLSLPRLATVTVKDKEGRPVPGARVLLLPKRGTPFHLGGFTRYEAGWTDSQGRAAVPAEDLEGRTVAALAWSFEPGLVRGSGKGAGLVLEKSEMPEFQVDLRPASKEVVFGEIQGLAPRDLEVSSIFQEGRFFLPFSRVTRTKALVTTSGGLFFWGKAKEKEKARLEASKIIRLEVTPEDPGARFALVRHGYLPSGYRPRPGRTAELLDLCGRKVSAGRTVADHLALGRQVVLEAKDSYPLAWALQSLEEVPREVSFRKVPGKKGVLRAFAPGGRSAAGALLRYRLDGNRDFLEANLARARKGEPHFPKYGGIHLDREGRFEIVLPEEAELLVFLRMEGRLLAMGRLRGGEEKNLRLRPGAWAVVEGAGAQVRATPLSYPPRAAGAARYLGIQKDRGKRTGAGEPIFMGPLFPGKYLFRTSSPKGGFEDGVPLTEKKTVLLESGKVHHVRF